MKIQMESIERADRSLMRQIWIGKIQDKTTSLSSWPRSSYNKVEELRKEVPFVTLRSLRA